MWKNTLKTFLTVALCGSYLKLGVSPGLAADTEAGKQARKDVISRTVKKWQKILGNVDFAEGIIFKHMVYLHPQPVADFVPFGDAVLSDSVKANHQLWVHRFFKGALLESLLQVPPSGYYLKAEHDEPSLLLFRAKMDGNELDIMENCNVIFLSLRPRDFDPAKGIPAENLVRILRDWTKLNERAGRDVFHESAFPMLLKEGDKFWSTNAFDFLRYPDWSDHLVGFVGDNGICLLFLKMDPDEPGVKERGYLYDYTWLNRGLLKKDGKTLVDPSAPLLDRNTSNKKPKGRRLRE